MAKKGFEQLCEVLKKTSGVEVRLTSLGISGQACHGRGWVALSDKLIAGPVWIHKIQMSGYGMVEFTSAEPGYDGYLNIDTETQQVLLGWDLTGDLTLKDVVWPQPTLPNCEMLVGRAQYTEKKGLSAILACVYYTISFIPYMGGAFPPHL